MKRIARFALASALVAAAAGAAAQDITFFEQPDFNGRRFNANNSVPNLSELGFNDRASSVVVRSGSWQVCSDAFFRGRCVTLPAGEYRNLSQIGLANQVSSARELGFSPGPGPVPGPGPGPGPGGPVGVTLYQDYGFGGQSLDINQPIPNLARNNFNDRARSIVVHGGVWEVCRDDGFRDACQSYGPGRHANLGSLAGEASSIRPVGGGAPGGEGSWGGGARVVLYEQPNFGGRRIAVNQEFLPNLVSTGFNDRASSLRIERGYWMFCSDADFRGNCRTFGPGDYAQLPPGLNNSISSGRRIHNDYPYNSSPNWSGYTQQ